MQNFLPSDFYPKEKMVLGSYTLKKFQIEDNPKDYATVMKHGVFINKMRGGKLCHADWPPADFTLEENLEDVKSFIEDFEKKESVSYIIWDSSETEYLGCVYIYPIDYKYPELQDKYDVDFSMWVTEDVYNQGEFPTVYKLIWDWLQTEWPFQKDRVFHRNAMVPIEV